MGDRYELLKDDPIACREEAKKLLDAPAPTTQEQNLGIKLLTRAVKLQDPEAMYVMGKMFEEHRLKPLQGGYLENGMRLIRQSADLGYGPAKIYIDKDYSTQSEPNETAFQYNASCTYDYQAIRALVHLQVYGKFNPKTGFMIWSIIYGVIIAAYLLSLIVLPDQDSLEPVIMWTLLYGFTAFTYFGLPRVRYNAQAKLKNIVNEFVFMEDRLQIQSTGNGIGAESSVSYEILVHARETGRYLFLWQSKNHVFIVDKNTFNGGMPQQLRDKLRSILGKHYVICKY